MKGKDECWPWKGQPQGSDGRAYFQIQGKKFLAYRLVYELYTGDTLTEKEVIRHTCDNGAAPIMCCNPYHLVKGSHQDNMDDMKTRQRHGLPHHAIRAIRRAAKNGRTHAEIAELFGISRSNVTSILNRKTYKHVED